MQCSQDAIAGLFYNISSSFFLFFIFFFFTSILLSKFFQFFGKPIFHRNQDVYGLSSPPPPSEEEEEGEEEEEHDSSYFHGGCGTWEMEEETVNDSDGSTSSTMENSQDFIGIWQSNQMGMIHEHEPYEVFLTPANSEHQQQPPAAAAADDNEEEEEEEHNDEIPSLNSHADHKAPQSTAEITEYHEEREKQSTEELIKNINGGCGGGGGEEEENYTMGSISRDSSDWRNSSYTEDPFSSSSRRSCIKWESYPIFQKYQDEMLIFDRIIWEKLQESETLRFIQSRPKSISKRILHKLIPATKQSSSSSTTNYHRRHYQELESAYVSQLCLTWEALSWNYNYFRRLKTSRRHADPGCPAYVAQQFQQFQVLLQRYNETEPYEHGKRHEIYGRKRISSPKLLQVPEYRDSNEEDKERSHLGSRIPSDSFLQLLEESIKTFMEFLKADKQSRISKLIFFEIRTDSNQNPNRILLLKKVNKKKRRKVKELHRGGHRWSLFKKTRELKGEEEMEILTSLIDLKVVERVLRMGFEFDSLFEEKLQWCEEKMKKVRLQSGKVKRDSSTSPPIHFPAAAAVSGHHHHH